MNRPIKFRAWVNDAMVYDIQEEYDTLGYRVKVYKNNSLIESGDYRQTTFTDYFEYPVMQFIGRYDKNGKEIYEKDIVKYNYIYCGFGNLKRKTIIVYGIVKYSDSDITAGFEVDMLSKETNENKWAFYDPESQTFAWRELEVIGNQFENPELLEASDEQ